MRVMGEILVGVVDDEWVDDIFVVDERMAVNE